MLHFERRKKQLYFLGVHVHACDGVSFIINDVPKKQHYVRFIFRIPFLSVLEKSFM